MKVNRLSVNGQKRRRQAKREAREEERRRRQEQGQRGAAEDNGDVDDDQHQEEGSPAKDDESGVTTSTGRNSGDLSSRDGEGGGELGGGAAATTSTTSITDHDGFTDVSPHGDGGVGAEAPAGVAGWKDAGLVLGAQGRRPRGEGEDGAEGDEDDERHEEWFLMATSWISRWNEYILSGAYLVCRGCSFARAGRKVDVACLTRNLKNFMACMMRRYFFKCFSFHCVFFQFMSVELLLCAILGPHVSTGPRLAQITTIS